MAETPDKKKPDADLIPRSEQDVELQRALAHPVVKHMAEKLETMKSLLEQLPEAIGRAVAAQMGAAAAQQPPDGASAPPVPLTMAPTEVAFGRGGQVKLAGREEDPDPAGLLTLMGLAGIRPDKYSVEKVTGWTRKQRQQVAVWARAAYLKRGGMKGVRVPKKPSFL